MHSTPISTVQSMKQITYKTDWLYLHGHCTVTSMSQNYPASDYFNYGHTKIMPSRQTFMSQ